MTQTTDGDLAGKVGIEILSLQFLNGEFKVEALKSMLSSLKEEAKRLLGLLKMGFVGNGLVERASPLVLLKGKDAALDDARVDIGLGCGRAQASSNMGSKGMSVYNR